MPTLTDLPPELLEPILHHAIVPGTASGAALLLVNSDFHACGRARLYEHVDLRSQEGYDSYFLLAPHYLQTYRPLARSQRIYDYANLRFLTLSYAPVKKVPPHLSLASERTEKEREAFLEDGAVEDEDDDNDDEEDGYDDEDHGVRIGGGGGRKKRFPRLEKVTLDLARGDSYMTAPPKPLSRRISKFLSTFSPPHLILSLSSSSEITLASILPHHLLRTQTLQLASHHVGHLPLISRETCPWLTRVIVRARPAVRPRDLKLLCVGLTKEVTKGGRQQQQQQMIGADGPGLGGGGGGGVHMDWRSGGEDDRAWGWRESHPFPSSSSSTSLMETDPDDDPNDPYPCDVGSGRSRRSKERRRRQQRRRPPARDRRVEIQVRWLPLDEEGWWDREMREEVEREVQEAQNRGDLWVRGVVLMHEDEAEMIE